MSDAVPNPFIFPPDLWFGLLCHAIGRDETGHINLLGIFNKVFFYDPPEASGVTPHAAVNGILAIGFSGGLGHFEATIELRNADGHTVWRRAEPWPFDLGPGEQGGAILAEQVRHWLTQLGQYHYYVRLEPSGQEHQIDFDVQRQIAPTQVEGEQEGPPNAPQ